MAGGLVGLLDDIATLAKAAAASIDDVGVAAGKASVKAAGVVVDDAAVTPAYVHGLAAERELPIIKRIAVGSLRNKLVFILPAALVLSAIAPVLVEIVLMAGGTFLCYEGAHKIHHRWTHRSEGGDEPLEAEIEETFGPEHEAQTVAGAIRTDFILSGEIMVIALKEVIDEGFVSRAAILLVVAVVITAIVYGVVALIVKMDDVGVRMVASGRPAAMKVGRGLVAGMPKLLAVLSVVGTAAMLWVGGHILLAGANELGWHTPYDWVHDLEHHVHDIAGVGGALGWTVNTLASAIVGLAAGFLVLAVVRRLPIGQGDAHHADAVEPVAHDEVAAQDDVAQDDAERSDGTDDGPATTTQGQ
jgi:predicted DNA repair protein MutK